MTLPESGNPYEILGVSSNAGEETLRRAYVARIRQYRPETHPEEFDRIRKAYETARSWLGLDTGPTWRAGEEAAREAWEPPGDPVLEPIRSAWEAAAKGKTNDAWAILASLRREHPAVAVVHLHAFLLEEVRGAPRDEALVVLLEGLESGASLAGDIGTLLGDDEIRRFAALIPQGWALLRRQPDRSAAARLQRLHVHGLLLAGRDDEAFAEIESRDLLDAAMESEDLAWLAREAGCVAAWDRSETAERLHRQFAPPDGLGFSLEDHYVMARRLSGPFLGWRRVCPTPWIDRFVRLAPILDAPDLDRVGRALHADFVARPQHWVNTLLAMRDESMDLLEWYGRSLRGTLLAGEEVASDPWRSRIEEALTLTRRLGVR